MLKEITEITILITLCFLLYHLLYIFLKIGEQIPFWQGIRSIYVVGLSMVTPIVSSFVKDDIVKTVLFTLPWMGCVILFLVVKIFGLDQTDRKTPKVSKKSLKLISNSRENYKSLDNKIRENKKKENEIAALKEFIAAYSVVDKRTTELDLELERLRSEARNKDE